MTGRSICKVCGEAVKCEYVSKDERKGPLIWLDFSGQLAPEFRPQRVGGLYAVEFVGRRHSFRRSYGHMGMFDEEVIVDRMMAIRRLPDKSK